MMLGGCRRQRMSSVVEVLQSWQLRLRWKGSTESDLDEDDEDKGGKGRWQCRRRQEEQVVELSFEDDVVGGDLWVCWWAIGVFWGLLVADVGSGVGEKRGRRRTVKEFWF